MSDDLGELVRDLAAGSEQMIETHISWVFLRQGDVLKVKKPVNFGFLDFSELRARELACRAEVKLNERLAKGVYLGVVPIVRDGAGRHQVGGAGQAVEYAVHMTRLPSDARADLRLARGELGASDLERLAVRLARFHAGASRSEHIGEFGRIELIQKNVEENFAQAASLLQALGSEAVEREVEERQRAFLQAHAELFAQRITEGRVCDGHGDLRLEHVYLLAEREPVVIDCIEFNERFRYADACADVAFLSMDLAFYGRSDLKERFLAAYAREAHDHDLYALVDFYESYRAYVRAKVSALSLGSSSLSFEAREELAAKARRYLLLALAAERPALGSPRLIAVGGVIASGKSSLAEALGQALAAPVVSTDETRKRLLGVTPRTFLGQGAWQSAYSREVTEQVYGEVLRRARVVLASGRSVLVDASFRLGADRVAARELARSAGASFLFIECRAPRSVARARLESREREGSVSDGRAELLDEFAARYEPVTELGAAEHLVVDTGGALEASLAQLRAAFEEL